MIQEIMALKIPVASAELREKEKAACTRRHRITRDG